FETLSDIVERRPPKAVVAVERLQRPDEQRIADLLAQHVPNHRGLAVANGFRDGIVAALETRRWEGVLGRDEGRGPVQDGATMLGALAALLGDEVVGKISGQAFTPVATRKVDEYAVAPPVVQQLMRIRGMQDEWKPDDLLAQERERRHAVAGLPEVLHQSEL